MRSHRHPCLPLALFLAASPASASATPATVSPGTLDVALTAAAACPTFSWALSATSGLPVEIAVFELEENGLLAERPAMVETLPAGASSWTPPAERCLEGGRYAWTVRERHPKSAGTWAPPRLFRVAEVQSSDGVEKPGRHAAPVFEQSVPASPRLDVSFAPRDPRNIASEALFNPPNCVNGSEMFTDVDNLDPFCEWVEQLAKDEIAVGCTAGPDGRFCPDDPVTRRQLAVYLERAMRGTDSWHGGPQVTRSIPIPLTSLVDCQLGGYLSFDDDPPGDDSPHFAFTGTTHAVLIHFDAESGSEDDDHRVCTRLMFPTDYVAGTSVRFVARAESITPSVPNELLAVELTRDDGTNNQCTATLANTAGVVEASCQLSTNSASAGESFALKVRAGSVCCAGPMNDGLQLYALELRYTATQ